MSTARSPATPSPACRPPAACAPPPAVVSGPVYFAANAGFSGSASFGYTVTDNSGAPSANTATASITIGPVNDAPVLGGLAASVTYTESATATVTQLRIDTNVTLSDI